MARNIFYEETPDNKVGPKWQAGLYIRLSQEDDGDKQESNSITNQRLLLSNYANDLSDVSIKEIYIDDGYSGINFDRPGFLRLITDIKEGDINCIIVKDLSRFSRDMSGIREYLEVLFPSLNCRFISVIDHLDSFKRPEEIGSIFVQFKHLMNEHYCREISQKTREAFDSLRRDGKLVSAFAPYGYKKDPNNKHHLIIDEAVVDNVRLIFKLCLSGFGVARIAKHMNTFGITSPTEYRVQTGDYTSYGTNVTPLWSPTTIRSMLKNKVYIGVMEQRKHSTQDYRSKQRKSLPESKHIIVKDTHDAIISKHDFTLVQSQFERCVYTPRYQEQPYMFSGFLRCMDCGRGMGRTPKRTKNKTYVYYKCRTYYDVSKEKCPHSHAISHDDLTSIVFHAINAQLYAVANLSNILNKISVDVSAKEQIIRYNRLISVKKRTIDSKYHHKSSIYEDWKTGNITEQEYFFMKTKYDDGLLLLNLK